jgi:hypothetical protein
LSVESLNGLLGMSALAELDEGKPSGAAGLAIDGENHLGRRSHRAKVRAQFRFRRVVRQVTDEQSDGQSTLS